MANEIVVRCARSYADDPDSPRSYEISVDKFLTDGLPVVGTRLRFGADNDDTNDHLILRVDDVAWVIDGTQKLICNCSLAFIRSDDVNATADERDNDGERLIPSEDEIALFDTLAFSGADAYEPPPPEEP